MIPSNPPSPPLPLFLLFSILRFTKYFRNFEAALSSLSQAVKLAPSNHEIQRLLARTQQEYSSARRASESSSATLDDHAESPTQNTPNSMSPQHNNDVISPKKDSTQKPLNNENLWYTSPFFKSLVLATQGLRVKTYVVCVFVQNICCPPSD